jgi:HTH-type transcriptional regulator/antitoxin HigA
MTMPTTTAPIDRPITTEAEYAAAVAEIDELLASLHAKGSPAGNRLYVLALLVEDYETAHGHTMEDATPQEMVLGAMEQRGRDRAWLAKLMGGNSRVSDFLNGKRHLSFGQISKLHEELRIPIATVFPLRTRPEPVARSRKLPRVTARVAYKRK